MTRLADGRITDKLGVKLAQIDCQASPKICDTFRVDALPSLRVLDENGKTYEYEGQQYINEIIAFLHDRGYLASSNIIDMIQQTVGQATRQVK